MEGLKLIPYVSIILLIAGVIIGASMITLGTFGTTMDQCFNTSYSIQTGGAACSNTSRGDDSVGKDDLNLSDEYFAVVKAKEGMTTLAEQQPTVAIIAVMVIIISIIAGVFVYMKYF